MCRNRELAECENGSRLNRQFLGSPAFDHRPASVFTRETRRNLDDERGAKSRRQFTVKEHSSGLRHSVRGTSHTDCRFSRFRRLATTTLFRRFSELRSCSVFQVSWTDHGCARFRGLTCKPGGWVDPATRCWIISSLAATWFQVSWTESTHPGTSPRNPERSPGNFAHRHRQAVSVSLNHETERPTAFEIEQGLGSNRMSLYSETGPLIMRLTANQSLGGLCANDPGNPGSP
jgi:hypothetical protein